MIQLSFTSLSHKKWTWSILPNQVFFSISIFTYVLVLIKIWLGYGVLRSIKSPARAKNRKNTHTREKNT